MPRQSLLVIGIIGFVGVCLAASAWSDDHSPNLPPAPAAAVARTPDAPSRAAAESAARQQAKLAHQIYATTLDVIHERYFRNDRSTVPARAMEDVFAEVARQTKVEARWIGVNAKTMGINHEPRDDFEKSASLALAAGKVEFERIEGNYYRRAEAIPLAAGCLTCHGSFGLVPKTPRFAALVIRLPLAEPPAAH